MSAGMHPPPRGHLDVGSGSVLAIAVVATVIAVFLMVVPLYSVLSARQHVAGAADAAALAAADIAVGRVPGVPCDAAAAVARANGARVTDCQPDGVIVTVRASTTILGFPVWAMATAGPPGAAP